MYFRIIELHKKNRDYNYLKLVETVRKKGNVIQKTLLNFGNVDHWPKARLRELVYQLNQFCDLQLGPDDKAVEIQDAFDFGCCFAIDAIWQELALSDSIRVHMNKHNCDIDIVPAVKAMVFNRLLEPSSKLKVFDWVKNQAIREIYPQEIPLHHYYRSLDYLMAHKSSLEEDIFWSVNDLFNVDLSLVFYDLTSSYFEGNHCELAKHGYSRDHRPDRRQIEIGLLVNRQGIPIAHEVFEGNTKDTKTVPDALNTLKKRFNVQRCVFVGDNAMATPENIELLRDNHYEYIMSLKLFKDSRALELLKGFSKDDYLNFVKVKENLFIREVPSPAAGFHPDERLIICYNPERAQTTKHNRQRRIDESAGYLTDIRDRPPKKGRPKNPDKIKQMVERRLRKNKTLNYFTVRFTQKGAFTYYLNTETIAKEEKAGGIWILVTNAQRLQPDEIASGYRTLYEVENAFKEIKHFLRIRPIYHYKDLRVRAHVFICVLAYLIEKFIEKKLEQSPLEMSTRNALQKLKPLRMVAYTIMGKPVNKITKIVKEQKEIFNALGIKEIPKIPTFSS